jgi:ParB family chromosome partitioning protein
MTRVIPGGKWAESYTCDKILPGLTRVGKDGGATPREWSRWQVGEVLDYTLLDAKGHCLDTYQVRWHVPETPGAPATVVDQTVSGQFVQQVANDYPFPEAWAPGLRVDLPDGTDGTVADTDWTRPHCPILVRPDHGAQLYQRPDKWFAPAKIRPQQQLDERRAPMQTYQIITGNLGVVEHFNEHPISGPGYRCQVDVDDEGKYGDNKLAILAPDGKPLPVLDLSRLGPRITEEVRKAIKAHMDGAGQTMQPARPDRQPLPRYQATSGNKRAIDELRGYAGDGWILDAGYLPGANEVSVQLVDVDRVIANLPVEPYATILMRADTTIAAYRAQQKDKAQASEDPGQDCPRWVACRACGTVHRAEWYEGDVAPLLQMCDQCEETYFQPCEAPASGEAMTVHNPCLEEPSERKHIQPAQEEAAADARPAREVPAEVAEEAPAARQIGQHLTTETPSPKPPTPADPGTAPTMMIPLDLIDDLPGGNYRHTYDAEKMDELTALIREHGVVQPVIVRPAGDRYQLVAGYRRREAARRAGLTAIPAVPEADAGETSRQKMLVENLGREDLNPMDLARALDEQVQAGARQDPPLSQGDVAQKFGLSRSSLTEYLRLTKLPKCLRPLVEKRTWGIKTAGLFMTETSAYPDTVRDQVAAELAKHHPELSYQNAAEAIRAAILKVTHKPAARAAGQTQSSRPSTSTTPAPQQSGQDRTNPGQGTQQSGQNVQQTGPAPDATGQRSGVTAPLSSQAGTPNQTPAPQPPASASDPGIDPEVQRARELAVIGRRLWEGSKHRPVSDGHAETLILRECYLPLSRVLAHWSLRQQIGANSIPRTMGANRVDIPEQRVWFRSHDESSSGGGCEIKLDGTQLVIQAGQYGAVEATYGGSPVYYRVVLISGGASKSLHQQLVIQDGERHLVVTGNGSVLIRKELVPTWAALVNKLPGLPDENDVLPGKGGTR